MNTNLLKKQLIPVSNCKVTVICKVHLFGVQTITGITVSPPTLKEIDII